MGDAEITIIGHGPAKVGGDDDADDDADAADAAEADDADGGDGGDCDDDAAGDDDGADASDEMSSSLMYDVLVFLKIFSIGR